MAGFKPIASANDIYYSKSLPLQAFWAIFDKESTTLEFVYKSNQFSNTCVEFILNRSE